MNNIISRRDTMGVFRFTRIKLMAWYVVAVMLVSAMFSIVLYSGVTNNIEQSFLKAENRLRNSPGMGQQLLQQVGNQRNSNDRISIQEEREALHQLFVDELLESKQRVLFNLLLANGMIFLATVFAGHFLSGKTLKPIEDSMIEQKRFVADASHELRTPLTSLRTAIEVSLRDKKLSNFAKQILQDNLNDVDALNNLIDNLLQLASQESKTIVKQLVDVHEILCNVLKTVKPLTKEKKIKVISKLHHKQIVASESSLSELFTVLIDNAIKFNKYNGTIFVEVSSTKRAVTIKIKDTGIGINKDYLPHVFDRFYRVNASRTVSKRQGFGLGLSVAKQIVENHNGTITVDSEIGKGTSFLVSLPL